MDKTKTAEGLEETRQAVARDKRAKGAVQGFDYGSGEDAVTRVHGLGIRYSEAKPTPDIESLLGCLDYDEDAYVKAVEISKDVPALLPDKLRTNLEMLVKADNHKELRQQLNIQAVRLGDDADALKEIRLKMTGLRANHPESQKVMMELVDDIMLRTEEKEWDDEG